MTARDIFGEFTRGALDRIREYCGIADVPLGFTRTAGGLDFVAPARAANGEKLEGMAGTLYQFWIFPGGRLKVRVDEKGGWSQCARVRNRDEALDFVLMMLHGVDPPSFGEKLP
jgi:hypothetical protein